jgi:hypothetical protein
MHVTQRLDRQQVVDFAVNRRIIAIKVVDGGDAALLGDENLHGSPFASTRVQDAAAKILGNISKSI